MQATLLPDLGRARGTLQQDTEQQGVTAGSLQGLTVCDYIRGGFTSTAASMAGQEPPPPILERDP